MRKLWPEQETRPALPLSCDGAGLSPFLKAEILSLKYAFAQNPLGDYLYDLRDANS